MGFNPSIEGQPLQRAQPLTIFSGSSSFNPSIEGQPLQPNEIRKSHVNPEGFNPSIEGQPLQQSRCRSLDFQWLQQAVFLTYG